ncbi:MAG: type VI secretion system protein TssA [Candidatus Competibacteraceae bacterium]|jgi:type VI secretion system protein ImpA|nr:type VI secretion system protein TssA [Candidatus Competibacteraceae bacterium]
MAVIDVEQLLQPVSPDAPSGEDLEYDTDFGELESDLQGKAEQQYGDTIIPAEEPDWRDIQKRTLALLERSKDLRLSTYLIRALFQTHGFIGLDEGLMVLRGLLETYWESVYPQLDPEDDNDPTMRANILASLCDWETVLFKLRDVPLVSSPRIGKFSLRDIDIATGVQPAPASSDEPPPDSTTIDAAFMDCPLEELQQSAQSVQNAIENVTAIDAYFTDQVGATNAPDLNPLVRELKEAQQVLSDRLTRRGVDVAVPEGAAAEEDITDGQGGQGVVAVRVGEITSRDDVIRMLDKICDFYAKHEPSSPIPLLLQRAKRLASKTFLDILRDLAPDGLPQAEMIRGPEEGAQQPSEESSESSW